MFTYLRFLFSPNQKCFQWALYWFKNSWKQLRGNADFDQLWKEHSEDLIISHTLLSLPSYCREIMAWNVASAGGMEGPFKGNNLFKWLHGGEHNTEQQKIWKCLIVSLKCLLLASRGPAGLVAFGSLLAEPHLPDICECYVPLMGSCSQKMVLEACGTSTPQNSLLCNSLKWQKTSQKMPRWQIFPKVQSVSSTGIVFSVLFFASQGLNPTLFEVSGRLCSLLII